MIAVIQRVTQGEVRVDGELIGSCGKGLVVLLGVAQGDTNEDADLISEKMIKLRIFSDENGKMNLSVNDVHGDVLVVSQFTLLANYRHGNRPDYMNAAAPNEANALYEYFTDKVREKLTSGKVATGSFGADMALSLTNDGPVTIVMESDKLKKTK